jgi:bis(5'-nucleosyl)-tetraphosphatase (symmetrical)
MATYAIGDVHGWFEVFQRLLLRIGFDRRRDRLWLTGDLVNRGPGSLAMLRWAAEHSDSLHAVLGNHDVHLLARVAGVAAAKRRDTIDDILEAPDRDELAAWLRRRPLLHREDGHVLVHAGLLPIWTVSQAEALARECEAALQGERGDELLERWSRKEGDHWRERLKGLERACATLSSFTRLRTLQRDGSQCVDFNGAPDESPKDCLPWYELGHAPREETVLFGHWAALGLQRLRGSVCLDSGIAWGRSLSALRLEDGIFFQEPAG